MKVLEGRKQPIRGLWERAPLEGALPESKRVKQRVVGGLMTFLNSCKTEHFHVAAVGTTALRDLGNTPLRAFCPNRKGGENLLGWGNRLRESWHNYRFYLSAPNAFKGSAIWATRPQKAKMLRVGCGPVADLQAKLLINNNVTGVTGL
jgi:hypothetical protein